jgi:hypothetical protein
MKVRDRADQLAEDAEDLRDRKLHLVEQRIVPDKLHHSEHRILDLITWKNSVMKWLSTLFRRRVSNAMMSLAVCPRIQLRCICLLATGIRDFLGVAEKTVDTQPRPTTRKSVNKGKWAPRSLSVILRIHHQVLGAEWRTAQL